PREKRVTLPVAEIPPPAAVSDLPGANATLIAHIESLNEQLAAARSREQQLREQFDAESEHQRAASRALDEIQRTRAANDELRGHVEVGRGEKRKLESQLAEFDTRLGSALQEVETLRGERQRIRREIDEMRQKGDAEWKAKMQQKDAAHAQALEQARQK